MGWIKPRGMCSPKSPPRGAGSRSPMRHFPGRQTDIVRPYMDAAVKSSPLKPEPQMQGIVGPLSNLKDRLQNPQVLSSSNEMQTEKKYPDHKDSLLRVFNEKDSSTQYISDVNVSLPIEMNEPSLKEEPEVQGPVVRWMATSNSAQGSDEIHPKNESSSTEFAATCFYDSNVQKELAVPDVCLLPSRSDDSSDLRTTFTSLSR